MNKYDLTPVEKHGDFYFKRDDLFQPFTDSLINGGKVRQNLCLFEENRDLIETVHEGKVITAASVTSPQGLIVALCAKEFGFTSTFGIGNTTTEDAIKNHPMVGLAHKAGSTIKILSETQAFNNVLYNRLKKEKGFVVAFGINLENDKSAIVDSIASQVENIPDEVNTMVIPQGSGITSGGILKGISKYKPNIKTIHLVQPFGYDRMNTVDKIEEHEPLFGDRPYDLKLHLGKYPYHKFLKKNYHGIDMDWVYESKAFEYMTENIQFSKLDNVCFWIIGNTNELR